MEINNLENTLFTDLTDSEQATVSGGLQQFSGASSSISGQATTGRVSGSEYASSSASQNTYTYPYPYGSSSTTTQTTAYGTSSGYTYPS